MGQLKKTSSMYRLIAIMNMKKVFFKTVEAVANCSKAMETRRIRNVCFALVASFIMFGGCKDDDKKNENDKSIVGITYLCNSGAFWSSWDYDEGRMRYYRESTSVSIKFTSETTGEILTKIITNEVTSLGGGGEIITTDEVVLVDENFTYSFFATGVNVRLDSDVLLTFNYYYEEDGKATENYLLLHDTKDMWDSNCRGFSGR